MMIRSARMWWKWSLPVALLLALMWLLPRASAGDVQASGARVPVQPTPFAQGGAATTVTLAADSDFYSQFYKDGFIFCYRQGGGGGGRGINIAYLDPQTGAVIDCRGFDTYIDPEQFNALSAFLNTTVPVGAIVLAAVADEGGFMDARRADPVTFACLTLRDDARIENGYAALEALGSQKIRQVGYWGSWALIAVKGQGALAEEYHNPAYAEPAFIPPSNYWCRMTARTTTHISATVGLVTPEPPTYTPTATATSTATSTTTSTHTPTATSTPISTHTPTATPTSTATTTATATATATREPTSTPDGQHTTATPVYLPYLARDWFDQGPHLPLAYGPYRPGQGPGTQTPSPAQIGEDLDLLKRDTNLVRTYGSCGELAAIPALAAQREMYVHQGIALTAEPAANQAEVQCIAQLRATLNNLRAAIAGNEVLLAGTLGENDLVQYIKAVKKATQLDVATGESWGITCGLQATTPRCPGLASLSSASDFLYIHIHPYWEKVPVEHAAAHVAAIQLFVRAANPGRTVIVGETGWPTCGDTLDDAVPGLEQQRRFIGELWHWSKLYDIPVVYFEAFDEPWKAGAGQAVEGCWGMYYADRTPKHAALDWSVAMPAVAAAPAVAIDHPQGDTATVTKKNCGVPLIGRVDHAQAGWQVKVEVFTDKWYLQDKWYAAGLAPIVAGKWSVPEVILAGTGPSNLHRIRATVVDASGNPVGSPGLSTEIGGIKRLNDCNP